MSQEQLLNNINVKVGQLEVMQKNNTEAIAAMASSVNKLVEKLDKSDDLSREALEKAKSAHKRIDDLIDDIEQKEKDRKSWREWALKVVLTPILVGALGMILWLIIEYKNARG